MVKKLGVKGRGAHDPPFQYFPCVESNIVSFCILLITGPPKMNKFPIPMLVVVAPRVMFYPMIK